MNNIQLNKDLKEIKSKFNEKMLIEKSTVGGNSISIFDGATNEDIGTYVYYDNVEARDADLENLLTLLKETSNA